VGHEAWRARTERNRGDPGSRTWYPQRNAPREHATAAHRADARRGRAMSAAHGSSAAHTLAPAVTTTATACGASASRSTGPTVHHTFATWQSTEWVGG
jgi:hypothetical protein